MTIQEIAKRITNEPYYFSPETMRAFGQTFGDFRVVEFKLEYLLYAPTKDRDGRVMGTSARFFDPQTNTLRSLTIKEWKYVERLLK